jgi:hypothetical protein
VASDGLAWPSMKGLPSVHEGPPDMHAVIFAMNAVISATFIDRPWPLATVEGKTGSTTK